MKNFYVMPVIQFVQNLWLHGSLIGDLNTCEQTRHWNESGSSFKKTMSIVGFSAAFSFGTEKLTGDFGVIFLKKVF